MQFTKLSETTALVENDTLLPILFSERSVVDILSKNWCDGDYPCLILRKEDIAEDFFDLKTRLAGEALQKFVNYQVRVAIVGSFGNSTGKSLQKPIRESNKGEHIHLCETMAAALAALAE